MNVVCKVGLVLSSCQCDSSTCIYGTTDFVYVLKRSWCCAIDYISV